MLLYLFVASCVFMYRPFHRFVFPLPHHGGVYCPLCSSRCASCVLVVCVLVACGLVVGVLVAFILVVCVLVACVFN